MEFKPPNTVRNVRFLKTRGRRPEEIAKAFGAAARVSGTADFREGASARAEEGAKADMAAASYKAAAMPEKRGLKRREF